MKSLTKISLLFASALLALLTPPVWAAPPEPPQKDGFGEAVDVNVVNVDVYVTDKSGQPVTGLHRDDFELLEDGKRVEVTNFEALTGKAAPAPQAAPSPAPAAMTTAAPRR
jgi:hypothetical protein